MIEVVLKFFLRSSSIYIFVGRLPFSFELVKIIIRNLENITNSSHQKDKTTTPASQQYCRDEDDGDEERKRREMTHSLSQLEKALEDEPYSPTQVEENNPTNEEDEERTDQRYL